MQIGDLVDVVTPDGQKIVLEILSVQAKEVEDVELNEEISLTINPPTDKRYVCPCCLAIIENPREQEWLTPHAFDPFWDSVPLQRVKTFDQVQEWINSQRGGWKVNRLSRSVRIENRKYTQPGISWLASASPKVLEATRKLRERGLA